MAHKTMVGGTAYEVSGGKTLVNGAAYNIKDGKTLVGGTAYEIGFAAFRVIVSAGIYSTNSTYAKVIVNGQEYDGSQLADISVPAGTEIEIYVGSTNSSGGIELNEESIVSDAQEYTYSHVVDSNVYIALSVFEMTIFGKTTSEGTATMADDGKCLVKHGTFLYTLDEGSTWEEVIANGNTVFTVTDGVVYRGSYPLYYNGVLVKPTDVIVSIDIGEYTITA